MQKHFESLSLYKKKRSKERFQKEGNKKVKEELAGKYGMLEMCGGKEGASSVTMLAGAPGCGGCIHSEASVGKLGCALAPDLALLLSVPRLSPAILSPAE